MKRKLSALVLLAAASMLASACTSSKPTTTTNTHHTTIAGNTVATACEKDAKYDGAGMLKPNGVWPGTPEDMFGYTSASFLPSSNCRTPLPVPTTADCASQFPWIGTPTADTPYLLAKSGVIQVLTGVIQGNHPEPKNVVIVPQEVDEKVLIVDGDSNDNTVTRFAAECGQRITVDHYLGYRTTAASIDLHRNVPAVVIPLAAGKLLFVEFNSPGWTANDESAVVIQAIKDTNNI